MQPTIQSKKGNSVLVLSGVRGDTRRYRSFHPYEQLQLLGIPAVLSHITDPRLESLARGASMAIIHRAPYDRRVERLVRTVAGGGGTVLLDADDLTFWPEAFQWIDSPDFRDPVRADLYREDLRRNQKTFEISQGMTASTDTLAGLARKMGKPAWVYRNAFNLEMLAASEKAIENRSSDSGRVVIGYASGTLTHNKDFAKISGVLQAALQNHPECQLWTIGPLRLDDGWQAYASQVRQLSWVPWRDLPALLAHFDINLAPLVSDNPFTQSKSEIKYVEAGLVRVPTIASPTEAFRYAIRHGENGFLAETPEDWAQALESLICAAKLRNDVGETAFRDAMERYHPRVRAQELVDILGQASEALTGHRAVWPVHPRESEGAAVKLSNPGWENHPTLLEMGIYNLRQRGLKTLLRQMWVFFRRLISPILPFR